MEFQTFLLTIATTLVTSFLSRGLYDRNKVMRKEARQRKSREIDQKIEEIEKLASDHQYLIRAGLKGIFIFFAFISTSLALYVMVTIGPLKSYISFFSPIIAGLLLSVLILGISFARDILRSEQKETSLKRLQDQKERLNND